MEVWTYEDGQPIALTQTVKKGGCAAKLPAGELSKVLNSLSIKKPQELLVGVEKFDDAGLWDLKYGRLMINTLDFFTPIVDDPKDFGRIAAANALSDVYAMGGVPAMALTILAFPTATLPFDIIHPLMAGALEKINESGAALAGGHSIEDETLKLGFSVSGLVAKDKVWTNAGAQPGDVLILTKALGVGTLVSAFKEGVALPEWIRSAIDSMVLLNRVPELLVDEKIHAATDITGFGLGGHGMEMALASGVTLTLNSYQLPILPGALECLENGILNRAHKTNRDYSKGRIKWSAQLPTSLRWLILDAQTSGGLLLAAAPERAQSIVAKLKPRFPMTCEIGRVSEASQGQICLEVKA